MTEIPVVDATEAAAWDETARTAHAIPSRVLMESAGRACVAVIAREFGRALGSGVVVVCGMGNDGGDGWVVARALNASGVRTWAVTTGDSRAPDCKANRELAESEGVRVLNAADQWPASGLIVDALLGTGASGELRDSVAEAAKRIDAHGAPVVAVDGPTGVDLTTGSITGPITADLTVTFGGLRRGHLLARERCGKVVVTDIGFPPPDDSWPRFVHDRWASNLLPRFDVEMHKGERGKVVVIGGMDGMSGAALHAARAAFSAGAGLVKLVASHDTVRAAQSVLPDVMTVPSSLGPDAEAAVLECLEWADAVVLGPGLGRSDDRNGFVKSLLIKCAVPVIADADALRVERSVLESVDHLVVTPHVGEFSALFPELSDAPEIDPFAAAAEASRLMKTSVLLKGVPTVIAAGGAARYVVGSGNPALATGGSGDVLAGFIGAILARGVDPTLAAALGAHIMGRAAEVASLQKSVRAARPADVMDSVREVLREWEDQKDLLPPYLLELEKPATQW